MSFQFVIDNAATLSIRRTPLVATTTARDGTVRAVSRGTPLPTIEVKIADGISWQHLKAGIEAAEALYMIGTDTIVIPYEGFEWYYNYIPPTTPETYEVRCVSFPQWTIFERNQVSWSGPFVFQVQE